MLETLRESTMPAHASGSTATNLFNLKVDLRRAAYAAGASQATLEALVRLQAPSSAPSVTQQDDEGAIALAGSGPSSADYSCEAPQPASESTMTPPAGLCACGIVLTVSAPKGVLIAMRNRHPR
ncbi:MAG: hypothetical protein M3Z31_01795, partial [Pseudomonadota bacterium]|nr:hypothetical protein [Pseudomonadota bacterium]